MYAIRLTTVVEIAGSMTLVFLFDLGLITAILYITNLERLNRIKKIFYKKIKKKGLYMKRIRATMDAGYLKELHTNGTVCCYPLDYHTDNDTDVMEVNKAIMNLRFASTLIDKDKNLNVNLNQEELNNLITALENYKNMYYSIVVYTDNNDPYRLFFDDKESLEKFVKRDIDNTNMKTNQVIDGLKQGLHIEKYDNGKVRWEGHYKNGKIDGKWVWYYENGKIMIKGNYKDNKEVGKWTGYHENGNIHSKYYYKDGKLISQKDY